MKIRATRKSRKYAKVSGPPCNGPAMGSKGPIKFGGRVCSGALGNRPRGSDTSEVASAPAWVAGGIPDQTDATGDQPLSLIAATYVEKAPYPLTFSLVTPPAGFYITGGGKITVIGAAVAAHTVTVRAANPHGTTDDTFTWTITA